MDGLKEILAGPNEETLLLAGVDFSHVGPKFGHPSKAKQMQDQTEAHDRSLMEHLATMDADGFWAESIRVNDRFNVCGFSALAAVMKVLSPAKGEILDYEFNHEAPTRSAVSFTAMVFTVKDSD